jgi:hypothetical protein
MNGMDPRDNRLSSQYYTPAQLIALGRIAELSALLEVLLRNVLGQVMGISQAASEALFLGTGRRTLSHEPRISANSGTCRDGSPRRPSIGPSESARSSESGTTSYIGPRVMLYCDEDDDERVVGWNRGRRAHEPMPIDNDQLLGLIERLAELQAEAMHKLFWGEWETSVGNAASPDA